MSGNARAADSAHTERPAGAVRIILLTFVAPIPALVVFSTGVQRLGAFPVWVQWLVVTTAFLSRLGMALALLLPLWREQWLKFVGYQRENGFALTPSFLALWPAFFATTGFALMLDFLYQRGVASVEPPTAMEAATWPTFPYFVWNFLDAIPYLEIPRTLSWELGFEFTDHVTPVLLLAYKILIIGPVIALAVTVWTDAAQLWKARRQKRPMASE